MNFRTRNGKIARLPKAIREELNQRLDEGATGRSLVAWLNSLLEVRAVLEAHFGSGEIREQNLSEWKKGGYQEWVRHQEAMALAERLHEQAKELKAQGKERMPIQEALTLWLSARYAAATQEIETSKSPEAWQRLREMCTDVARLRRLEQQEQRLALEAERVELKRQEVAIKQERWKEEKREKRAAAPEAKNQEEAESEPELTPEERARRLREVFGRAPDWQPETPEQARFYGVVS